MGLLQVLDLCVEDQKRLIYELEHGGTTLSKAKDKTKAIS